MPDNVDVLLVEDNLNDAELTIRALRKNNLSSSIVHVNDGEEALDFIYCKGAFQSRSFNAPPKIILLDLKMPKVDGMEVLRRLKSDERTKIIPIVLLTSSKEDKDILEGYRLGVNSYLVKPVDYQGLVKFVADLGTYWLSLNQSPELF